MKSIIAILILLSAAIFAGYRVHHGQRTITSDVALLNDVTDRGLAQPDSNAIFSLYGLHRKWQMEWERSFAFQKSAT